jgi:GAF domain-containing protein
MTIEVRGRPRVGPAASDGSVMTEPGGPVRSDPGGWAPGGPADGDELLRLVSAWTIGLDTLARAAAAAVTASAEAQLRSATADALSGRFADWVFVDFLTSSTPRRAVSARRPDPGLAAALGAVPAESCPVITSAVQHCTPQVRAAIDDQWMLGSLPDGRPVASVIGAQSVAVGPILFSGAARGAITIVRGTGAPRLGFRELGILSHIARLAGAAADRLRGGKESHSRE